MENTNVIDGKCGLFGLIEIKDNGGKLVGLFEIMDTKQTLFTSVKYPEYISGDPRISRIGFWSCTSFGVSDDFIHDFKK